MGAWEGEGGRGGRVGGVEWEWEWEGNGIGGEGLHGCLVRAAQDATRTGMGGRAEGREMGVRGGRCGRVHEVWPSMTERVATRPDTKGTAVWKRYDGEMKRRRRTCSRRVG